MDKKREGAKKGKRSYVPPQIKKHQLEELMRGWDNELFAKSVMYECPAPG